MENRHITTAMCDRPNYLLHHEPMENGRTELSWTFHKTFWLLNLIYDLWSCNKTYANAKPTQNMRITHKKKTPYAHKINQRIYDQLFKRKKSNHLKKIHRKKSATFLLILFEWAYFTLNDVWELFIFFFVENKSLASTISLPLNLFFFFFFKQFATQSLHAVFFLFDRSQRDFSTLVSKSYRKICEKDIVSLNKSYVCEKLINMK